MHVEFMLIIIEGLNRSKPYVSDPRKTILYLVMSLLLFSVVVIIYFSLISDRLKELMSLPISISNPDPTNTRTMLITIVEFLIIYSLALLGMGQLLVISLLNNLKKYRFRGIQCEAVQGLIMNLNGIKNREAKYDLDGFLVAESEEYLLVKPDNYPVVRLKRDGVDIRIIIKNNEESISGECPVESSINPTETAVEDVT